MTPTTQYRIPTDLKNTFRDICEIRNYTMTETVIQLLSQWVIEQSRDPLVRRKIKITETEKQTGLRQDARGTWVRPETLPPDENDWRNSLL